MPERILTNVPPARIHLLPNQRVRIIYEHGDGLWREALYKLGKPIGVEIDVIDQRSGVERRADCTVDMIGRRDLNSHGNKDRQSAGRRREARRCLA